VHKLYRFKINFFLFFFLSWFIRQYRYLTFYNQISLNVNDFFEGRPTRSFKNGTNKFFIIWCSVTENRVFMEGRKFYTEKTNLEKWVTRRTKYRENVKKL
jgi:hypothetical protein